MFSRASFRQSLVAYQHLIRTQLFNTKSQSAYTSCSSSASFSSSSSQFNEFNRSSRYGDKNSRSSSFDLLMKSVFSGFVVGGSIFGFDYISPSYSYADLSFSKDGPSPQDSVDHNDKKSKLLFGDNYRKRVFFNYENRIRTHSPPEKVFEYFASVHNPNGEVHMTPRDLMRAVIPVFPPSEAEHVREGYLKGERVATESSFPSSKFFMLFDTNGDGLISFPEYTFFVTLLSIPEMSFSVAFKMFDLNNNGEIDKDEFKKVMSSMMSQISQGANRRLGNKVSVEELSLVEYFFGKDGKKRLQHDKFSRFLKDLHNEILRLEFLHYDHNSKGTISAKDFALSLVASADSNNISKLLDRVDAMSDEAKLTNIRITSEEFKKFAELRKNLQTFSMAIFTYGMVNETLTKEDFLRAASRVCGIVVSKNVVDIIYHVFDTNGDGKLSANEFIKALQRRENDASEPGLRRFFSCLINCITSCL